MQGRRALLIDDEVHIIMVLARRLEKDGYEVHTASDGLRGIETAHAIRPDIVVTDLQMPRLSGVEVAQQLNDSMPDVPVLLLTARGYVLGEYEIPPNVRACLPKPFSAKEIVARLDALLAEPETEDEPRTPRLGAEDAGDERRVA